MDRIDIQVDDREVQVALGRARQRLANTRPLMAGIASLMLETVEDAFDQERDPTTGAPWPRLSRRTIEQRSKAKKWPGRILQASGQLAVSVSSTHNDTSATVSTNKVYARIHQFGGPAGRGHKARLPERPYLGLGSRDKTAIVEQVEKHISLTG
ncbi:MAG: phage virion morphogenesis protein [Thiothrix sp.]|nr:phage virion morphogenesis protein [Thiothrix sp.]